MPQSCVPTVRCRPPQHVPPTPPQVARRVSAARRSQDSTPTGHRSAQPCTVHTNRWQRRGAQVALAMHTAAAVSHSCSSHTFQAQPGRAGPGTKNGNCQRAIVESRQGPWRGARQGIFKSDSSKCVAVAHASNSGVPLESAGGAAPGPGGGEPGGEGAGAVTVQRLVWGLYGAYMLWLLVLPYAPVSRRTLWCTGPQRQVFTKPQIRRVTKSQDYRPPEPQIHRVTV